METLQPAPPELAGRLDFRDLYRRDSGNPLVRYETASRRRGKGGKFKSKGGRA